MMTDTGEATARTTTTRAVSEERNLDSNSDSNSTADLGSDSWWTVEVWTMNLIIWKGSFAVLTFVIAVNFFERLAGRGTFREGRYGPPKDTTELEKFSMAVFLWSSPPLLILYGVALYGIVHQKLGLIRFCILLLCCEKVFDVSVVLYAHGNFGPPEDSIVFVFYFLSICISLAALILTIILWKRVALRNPRRLESEPTTTFHSAGHLTIVS